MEFEATVAITGLEFLFAVVNVVTEGFGFTLSLRSSSFFFFLSKTAPFFGVGGGFVRSNIGISLDVVPYEDFDGVGEPVD